MDSNRAETAIYQPMNSERLRPLQDREHEGHTTNISAKLLTLSPTRMLHAETATNRTAYPWLHVLLDAAVPRNRISVNDEIPEKGK